MEFEYKNVLVVGLGVSGNSAINFLNMQNCNVSYFDDEKINKIVLGANNRSQLTIKNALKGINVVVVSPGIALTIPLLAEAEKCKIPIIGEIELGYLIHNKNIIAITGTNGKTTTTMLIEKILKGFGLNAVSCGNTGKPFTEIALTTSELLVPIIEVSSFQLETCHTFTPKIGVFLNISPDHIERHKTLENYINAKKRLFQNMNGNNYAVLNYDDEVLREFGKTLNTNVFYFSMQKKVNGIYVLKNKVYFNCYNISEYICDLDEIALPGKHNKENALASICVAKILKFNNKSIISQVNDFMLPQHRVEFIAKINNVSFYNDSKGTNIGATLAACNTMEGKTLLIMGGYDKGISYFDFFEKVPKNITQIYLSGANKDKIKKTALECGFNKTYCFNELEECVGSAVKCDEVKNILFSPSTSSFDRYSDYKERGVAFCNIVKNYLI